MSKVENFPFVFLDTNILVALYNREDTLHQKAVNIFQELAKRKAKLVVSNYVLLEIFTILSQKAGKKKAIEFGKMIKDQKPFLIKRINEDLEEKTWNVFEKVKDKNLSYVDCSIITVILGGDYQLVTFDQKILKLQKQFGFRTYSLS